ncbi:hypothetical protein SESBI_31168 [Sesbania bispinosa]|nr:hypothetical protein SESBI_31168 [Sesbania bispinosa]
MLSKDENTAGDQWAEARDVRVDKTNRGLLQAYDMTVKMKEEGFQISYANYVKEMRKT